MSLYEMWSECCVSWQFRRDVCGFSLVLLGCENWSDARLGWFWRSGVCVEVGLLLTEWLDPRRSSWRVSVPCWGCGWQFGPEWAGGSQTCVC